MDIDSETQHIRSSTSVLRPCPSIFKNKQRLQRQSVSFSSTRPTLWCYDIPYNERQEWYNNADEEFFKEEARKEVAAFWRLKMKTQGDGRSVNDDSSICFIDPEDRHSMCIVGLEKLLISKEFIKKRARTRELVKRAVLAEQNKICTGYGDKAERIAESAMQYSEWSACQAKMLGKFQYIQSKESS